MRRVVVLAAATLALDVLKLAESKASPAKPGA